jgi:C_GCAxxG_C_C family probable redox protein
MAGREKAAELFAGGYNCAQSVLGAFCSEVGLDDRTALKITAGFGGGLSCGEICGAVSGAVMFIGLKCGFYDANDLSRKSYCSGKTSEFIKKFKEANGSLICRDLLSSKAPGPGGNGAPPAQKSRKAICTGLVECAAGLLESMEFED